MVKTCLRVRLLAAPSSDTGSRWQSLRSGCRCRRWGAADVKEAGNGRRWKRVCGACRGSYGRIRVNNQDCLSRSAATQRLSESIQRESQMVWRNLVDCMCDSAARVAEAFHALDGDRPRPDPINALDCYFGQAHAEPRESAFNVCHCTIRFADNTVRTLQTFR
jgi:hypothetical protein